MINNKVDTQYFSSVTRILHSLLNKLELLDFVLDVTVSIRRKEIHVNGIPRINHSENCSHITIILTLHRTVFHDKIKYEKINYCIYLFFLYVHLYTLKGLNDLIIFCTLSFQSAFIIWPVKLLMYSC